jgi:hypothetical protein
MSAVTQLREWRESEKNTQLSAALEPQIVEIATSGIDESMQSFGSDPWGGSSWVGLRIPTLATELLAVPWQSAQDSRYLLMLAAFSLSEGVKARVLGYRQMVRIGYTFARNSDLSTSTPRTVTQEVKDPAWHFVDGNVSFHLADIGPPNNQGYAPDNSSATDLRCFKQGFSMSSAVLYQSATVPNPFYVNLTAYKPPNKGRPWGKMLRSGGQATIYGQRTPWKADHAWSSLGYDVEGPATVVFFASVRQTNPATRTALTVPSPFYDGGLSAEEQFLLNFPNAIYHSVAGSLILRVGA